MKWSVLLAGLMCAFSVHAQSVDVKNVEASDEGNTTIEIKKGTKDHPLEQKSKWTVHDGEADVEGDSGATGNDAKANWKTACDNWKKEMRADNKENKILNLNCGKMTCDGAAGSKVCTSKATYKVKTLND